MTPRFAFRPLRPRCKHNSERRAAPCARATRATSLQVHKGLPARASRTLAVAPHGQTSTTPCRSARSATNFRALCGPRRTCRADHFLPKARDTCATATDNPRPRGRIGAAACACSCPRSPMRRARRRGVLQPPRRPSRRPGVLPPTWVWLHEVQPCPRTLALQVPMASTGRAAASACPPRGARSQRCRDGIPKW